MVHVAYFEASISLSVICLGGQCVQGVRPVVIGIPSMLLLLLVGSDAISDQSTEICTAPFHMSMPINLMLGSSTQIEYARITSVISVMLRRKHMMGNGKGYVRLHANERYQHISNMAPQKHAQHMLR